VVDEATIVGTAGHLGKLVEVYEWTCTQAMARRGRRRRDAVGKSVLWDKGRRRSDECHPRYHRRCATARSWRLSSITMDGDASLFHELENV